MSEHEHDDPVAHASTKITSYVSLAAVAAEALAQVSAARAREHAAADERAANALRAERQVAYGQARLGWAPILDPKLRDRISVMEASNLPRLPLPSAPATSLIGFVSKDRSGHRPRRCRATAISPGMAHEAGRTLRATWAFDASAWANAGVTPQWVTSHPAGRPCRASSQATCSRGSLRVHVGPSSSCTSRSLIWSK